MTFWSLVKPSCSLFSVSWCCGKSFALALLDTQGSHPLLELSGSWWDKLIDNCMFYFHIMFGSWIIHTLVRLQIVYCSHIWCSHFINDICSLERIRQKATKLILELDDYSSDYKQTLITLESWYKSMSTCLHGVQWHPAHHSLHKKFSSPFTSTSFSTICPFQVPDLPSLINNVSSISLKATISPSFLSVKLLDYGMPFLSLSARCPFQRWKGFYTHIHEYVSHF